MSDRSAIGGRFANRAGSAACIEITVSTIHGHHRRTDRHTQEPSGKHPSIDHTHVHSTAVVLNAGTASGQEVPLAKSGWSRLTQTVGHWSNRVGYSGLRLNTERRRTFHGFYVRTTCPIVHPVCPYICSGTLVLIAHHSALPKDQKHGSVVCSAGFVNRFAYGQLEGQGCDSCVNVGGLGRESAARVTREKERLEPF